MRDRGRRSQFGAGRRADHVPTQPSTDTLEASSRGSTGPAAKGSDGKVWPMLLPDPVDPSMSYAQRTTSRMRFAAVSDKFSPKSIGLKREGVMRGLTSSDSSRASRYPGHSLAHW